MDDLVIRLRVTGLTVCVEAADALEAQAHELAQWKLGSAVVAERILARLVRLQDSAEANGTV